MAMDGQLLILEQCADSLGIITRVNEVQLIQFYERVLSIVPFVDVSFYFIGKVDSKVSAPIYMDHVGCYGLEAKLVDCSYSTDTSEDDHSEDIGVQCQTEQSSGNDGTELLCWQ